MEIIASWDGTKENLEKIKIVSQFSGKYKNLEDLFEQWINDVLWLQQRGSYKLIPPEITYPFIKDTRVETFKVINKDHQEIQQLFSPFYFDLNFEQLVEILTIFSQFSGYIIDIGGGEHAITIRVLEDGSLKLYDPNLPFFLNPSKDIRKIAKIIYDVKYQMLNKRSKDTKKMNIHFSLFKIIDTTKASILARPQGKMDLILTENSANNFTPLHLAVLCNDLENLEKILSKETYDLAAGDLHPFNSFQVEHENRSAVDYAFLTRNKEAILKIMKFANPTLYFFNKLMFYKYFDEAAQFLQYHPDLDVNSLYQRKRPSDYSLLKRFLKVRQQHLQLVKVLLKHGFKIDDDEKNYIYKKIAKIGNTELLELIVQQASGKDLVLLKEINKKVKSSKLQELINKKP